MTSLLDQGVVHQELIELLDRMTVVLDYETDLLREGRSLEIAEIHEEKQQLAAALRALAGIFERDPELMLDSDLADPEDVENLIDAMCNMRAAAIDNERALKAAMKATEKVVHAVVRALREGSNPLSGAYSRTSAQPRLRNRVAAPVLFSAVESIR
jgi:flagellar biosynthesis/type III secretory pathway chaperone